MKNTRVLEMLNNGEIEELKKRLEDEIYSDGLKGNGTAAKRYAAMKRFFKNVKDTRNFMIYPGKNVLVDREVYNAFCDGYCIALTKESTGELEATNEYVNIENMFKIGNYDTTTENVDLNKILAKAKAKGYKYKLSETGISQEFKYAFKFKDAYYKIGILDKAFSIINDGDKSTITYIGSKYPLFIDTSVGKALVLPFRPSSGLEGKIIIDVDEILNEIVC